MTPWPPSSAPPLLAVCLPDTIFVMWSYFNMFFFYFLSSQSLIPSPHIPPPPIVCLLLSSFLPLFPLLGEGLSSSRLSLHKPGASSSASTQFQRQESRMSMLLNHLLPSSSSSGHSPLSTPQNTPTFFRRSSPSPPSPHGGPQAIPEVVVSPPEDDEPPTSTEDDAASPEFRRQVSSPTQGIELMPLEGKYLCSLPVWVTAWTENTSTSMKALLLPVNF